MRRIFWIALASIILLAVAAFGQAENPNTDHGFSPEKVYQFGEIDGINLFNGNLNVMLPIGQTYPVGGKLSYGLTLAYGGNNWLTGVRDYARWEGDSWVSYTATYKYPTGLTNAGIGWFLSLGGRIIYDSPIAFRYMSADGASHLFYSILHSYAGESAVTGIYYTRDGTYLKFNSATRVLESPDGLLREFDDKGRLVKMYDRASNPSSSPNWVSIAYNTVTNPIAAGSTTWHIQDSHGRHHYVYFKPTAAFVEDSTASVLHESVAAIDLTTFGDHVERYTFTYDQEGTVLDPGPWTTLTRDSCCVPAPSPYVQVEPLPDQTLATLLLKIQSTSADPNGTPWRYSFAYNVSNTNDKGGSPGTLVSVAMPSGGKIDYEYTNFSVPGMPCFPIGKCEPAADSPVSVGKRTVSDAAGVEIGHRTYSDVDVTYADIFNGHVWRTVTDYDPGGTILQKSRNYFSVCGQTNLSCAGTSFPGEYALPVTRVANGYDGLQLSSQQFGVTTTDLLGKTTVDWSQVARSIYFKYEADFPLSDTNANFTDWNRRVVAEATVYGDDGRWAKTVYSDFDGFGHYRQADATGNFDGANTRTAVTKYNSARGTFLPAVKTSNGIPATYQVPAGFSPWPTGSPWIIDTYTYQTMSAAEAPPGQSETTKTAMSIACFNANGFLVRRRQLASNVSDPSAPPLAAVDLLTVLTLDSSGNVTSEQHQGGDDGPAVSTTDTCSASVSDAYRVDHTWAKGVVATSQYADASGSAMSFRTVDHGTAAETALSSSSGIDWGTGLVRWSRTRAIGTAGMTTTYTYDFLGRLTEVRSDTSLGNLAEGGIVYQYTFSPAAVEIFHETAGSSPSRSADQPDGSRTPLPHQKYEFDVLGRVTKESNDMPDGSILSRVTSYNVLGWKTRVSEWETGTPSHFTTFTYDAFGRPLTIKAPDGSVVQQSYLGVSTTNRTVQVRTGTSSLSLGTTPATTTETADRYGRLRSVTEPDAGGGAGAATTWYTYDVGGRLASVCGNYDHTNVTCGQTRNFNYDNRGFLTSETHPEKGSSGNGTTYYNYDARGHVIRRYEGATGGVFDLTYGYDRAERIKTIAETNARAGVTFKRVLKTFDYGGDNATGDYRNGQLTRASRFNWFDGRNANVQIVEQYVYGGVGGRPSSRTTSEYECAISVGAACNNVAPNAALHVFTQTFTYDTLGNSSQLGYPCRDCASPIAYSTASSSYNRGRLTGVQFPSTTSAENTLSYSANGMLYQVQHSNGVTDTQQPDLNMMQRPLSFKAEGALEGSVCTAPTITANPSSVAVTSGISVTLSAAASGDSSAAHVLHYQWYKGAVGDTTAPVGTGTNQYQFTATTSSAGTYWMRAFNDCGANGTTVNADTATAAVTVCSAPAITSQPASTSTTKGISQTLSATATGQNLTYQWYAGSLQIPGEVSSSLTVTPAMTTVYSVAVKGDCGTATSSGATVTVYAPPTPPTTFTATGSTVPGSVGVPVQLRWSGATFPAGFGRYQIQRAQAGALGYFDYVSVTQTANDDNSVSHDPYGIAYYAYAYRIIAVDVNGARSAPSVPDVALVGILADDPLPVNSLIRGYQVSQLRRAIDAVRAIAGLNPMWTSYDSLTGSILAADLAKMRLALDEVRSMLTLPATAYTWPSPIPGQPIRRGDVEDLRKGVK